MIKALAALALATAALCAAVPASFAYDTSFIKACRDGDPAHAAYCAEVAKGPITDNGGPNPCTRDLDDPHRPAYCDI